MLRQSSTQTTDSTTSATPAVQAQAGKHTRSESGESAPPQASAAAAAGAGDAGGSSMRMDDWQPAGLLGAMGLDGGGAAAAPIQRKASGGGVSEGAEQAVATAASSASSSGAPLPAANRSAAESSLGVDLSSVRVHTGPAAQQAAASVSAQAYTQGSDIHFGAGHYAPGTASGDQLISHELVHVAQQQGGGGAGAGATQRKGLVTDSAEPAEAEADRGAAAIAAGEKFAVSERPSSGVARKVQSAESISGNPAERGSGGGGTATTTHRTPTLGDTTGAPAAAAAAAVDARAANVKVVADRAAPVHFDAPATPASAQIFEEGPQVSPAPAGFTAVTEIRGSIAAPMVEQSADNALFIANQPTADDVQQGGIGDCYFVAAAAGMASRDPGKLKSMMAADGNGGATVTLWRRQEHKKSLRERIFGGADQYDYTPVQVGVSNELAVNISDNRIHGAALRCAPQPGSVDYWSAINGGALEVHRKDVFQCARWVPLLEKAFARFAQEHGQYGGGAPAGQGGAAAGTPGYDAINSGVANYALHVLYGPAADAAGAMQYEWTSAFPAAGNNILAANPRVVDQLLMLAGRQDTAQPGDATAPIITAGTSPDSQINNLATAITNALADPDYGSLAADTKTKITTLQTAVTTWQTTPPDPANTAGPKATARTAVGNAAVEVARTPNTDHLAELNRHKPSPLLFDNASDAVRPADVPRLDFFGRWLEYVSVASLCPFVLTVTGHSSNQGTEADNQALSERRATNTNTALHNGRDAAKMGRHTYNVSGVGETGAAATADWRKVEITVAADRPDNELFAGARSAPLRAMMDLVLNVRNLGTDNSVGQRNVYAAHAYNVVGVRFVNAAGAAVPLETVPSASRPAMFPQVDCDTSTIRLRNPHHGNEPDRTGMNRPTHAGDGDPSGAASDGLFTMSVNEFFRNFNTLDTGVFPTTPNP